MNDCAHLLLWTNKKTTALHTLKQMPHWIQKYRTQQNEEQVKQTNKGFDKLWKSLEQSETNQTSSWVQNAKAKATFKFLDKYLFCLLTGYI